MTREAASGALPASESGNDGGGIVARREALAMGGPQGAGLIHLARAGQQRRLLRRHHIDDARRRSAGQQRGQHPGSVGRSTALREGTGLQQRVLDVVVSDAVDDSVGGGADQANHGAVDGPCRRRSQTAVDGHQR